jgi:hypothetical protein
MTTMSKTANANTAYFRTMVMTVSTEKHLLVDCPLTGYLSDLPRNLLTRNFRHVFLRALVASGVIRANKSSTRAIVSVHPVW